MGYSSCTSYINYTKKKKKKKKKKKPQKKKKKQVSMKAIQLISDKRVNTLAGLIIQVNL